LEFVSWISSFFGLSFLLSNGSFTEDVEGRAPEFGNKTNKCIWIQHRHNFPILPVGWGLGHDHGLDFPIVNLHRLFGRSSYRLAGYSGNIRSSPNYTLGFESRWEVAIAPDSPERAVSADAYFHPRQSHLATSAYNRSSPPVAIPTRDETANHDLILSKKIVIL
jgi:hypothetical protein